MEDLEWGVMGFLATGGVEAGGGELAEFVEYSLGGGFVGDRCADVVLFEEVTEAGEVAGARQRRKRGGRGSWGEYFGRSGEPGRVTFVGADWSGAEFLFEGRAIGQELEGSVVVGVGTGGSGGDSGAHGGWNAGVRCFRSVRGVGLRVVGGLIVVEAARFESVHRGRVAAVRGREAENEGSGSSAKVVEARVEGSHGRGGGGDMDVSETFVFMRGVGFAIGDREVGGNGVAFVVEEVEGVVSDTGVAWLEEGGADGITDLVAFGIDGLNVEGETGSKGIEDGARGHSADMGAKGGNGRTEGDFLDENVGRNGREQGKRNGRGGGVGSEGDRFVALGADGSGGDDSGVKLNHGGAEGGGT